MSSRRKQLIALFKRDKEPRPGYVLAILSCHYSEVAEAQTDPNLKEFFEMAAGAIGVGAAGKVASMELQHKLHPWNEKAEPTLVTIDGSR